MKLFYQSMGVARRSSTGLYAQTLRQTLEQSAAPGTTVTVHGLGEGKAIADQYRYLEVLDTQEILENGLRAEQDGYDGFLIGNIFEPGLHALREVLNIPVLGLCEASMIIVGLRLTTSSRPGEVTFANASRTRSASSAASPPSLATPAKASTAASAQAALPAWCAPNNGRKMSS